MCVFCREKFVYKNLYVNVLACLFECLTEVGAKQICVKYLPLRDSTLHDCRAVWTLGRRITVHPLQQTCSVVLDVKCSKLLSQLLSYCTWLCWSVSCMSSLSEFTASCHSLPVWHYLRYFSGSKAPFFCGPYLLWKTHFVTMQGRSGTRPQLGHICSFNNSLAHSELKFVYGHTREWLELMGCGRGFMGMTGKPCGVEW